MKKLKYILVDEKRTHGLQRQALIKELCHLRNIYPNAKILGDSELGEHRIRPSEAMNSLRRELSDLTSLPRSDKPPWKRADG